MKTTPKRVALYARVSTDSQTTENQLIELRATAARQGWEIVAEFVDHAVSGSKGRAERPQFNELHKGITRKEFDMVMSWSVDRLGRSLQDLVGFLGELQDKGVDLFLHQQGIDTSTPAGKMLFQMMGVFAEFERSMIVERVNAGLSRAKAQGKVLGRPRVSAETERAILAARAEGLGFKKIAAKVSCGVGTACKIVKAAEAAAA